LFVILTLSEAEGEESLYFVFAVAVRFHQWANFHHRTQSFTPKSQSALT